MSKIRPINAPIKKYITDAASQSKIICIFIIRLAFSSAWGMLYANIPKYRIVPKISQYFPFKLSLSIGKKVS